MIDERRRDYYAGGLVVLIGAATVVVGSRYPVGTLTRMGPGYFPLALGVLLVLLGAVLCAVRALGGPDAPPAVGDAKGIPHGLVHGVAAAPDWRGWGCIVGSVLLFIALAERGGLLAATFLSVLVACFGDRAATLRGSLLLAAGVSLFGAVLFGTILQVQIPLAPRF